MLVKAGVDISRLKPEIRRTLTPIEAWLLGLDEELVVNSTYEGNHMASSKHYSDDAYDIRRGANVLAHEKLRVEKMLGPDFDIVFYDKWIHVEYDPK